MPSTVCSRTLTIVLDAPVNTLVGRLGQKKDEIDEANLDRIRAGDLWEAKQRHLAVVFSVEDKDKVSNDIWKLTARTLSTRTTNASISPEPTSIKAIIAEKSELITGNLKPANPEPETLKQDFTDYLATLDNVYALSANWTQS